MRLSRHKVGIVAVLAGTMLGSGAGPGTGLGVGIGIIALKALPAVVLGGLLKLFFAIMVVAVLIITYWPWLSLVLLR